MVGRTLGQYRILEELGRGGMGTVYLGEDVQLHRRVAIKVISGAAHTDAAARARFLQEARAASALDHPNICAIYQIGETDEGAPFLVMAHYDGETLDRRIGAGPMRIGEAVGIAAQVADGLAHAHARGVVHRDIKPSNVLRTGDGVVKILDFGLAKIVGTESLTVTGVSIGTPAYMSPEQVRAEPVDARSDVWAVGVLLYALLIGRSPFEAENLAAVTYAILEGEPVALKKLLPRCPDGLQRIVDRCLAKAPKDRYADARALAADLRALAASLQGDDAMTIADTASGARTLQISTPSGTRRAATRANAWLRPAVIVAAIAIALFSARAWRAAHPPEPLRVAVTAPMLLGTPDSSLSGIGTATALTGVLDALSNLRDVAALDASELKGVSSPWQAARALAADEWVAVSLTPQGDDWGVALRRLSVRDSSVLWAASFTAPADVALSLAEAVSTRLAASYMPRHPRRGPARSRVAESDYAEFIDLQRRYRANFADEIPHDQMIARLEELRRRSPTFLEAPLLEAIYANHQFETSKRPEDLRLAYAAGEKAREIAPTDPRPLIRLFGSAALEGDWQRAATYVDRLRDLTPGDPDVTYLEARLAEGRGQVDDGIALLERLVRRRPGRVYFERLARMEYNSGRYDAARTHLEWLAGRYPTYVFPRAQLAQLELLYGSPAAAESLYSALAAQRPQVGYLSNLALAQMLLGKFAASEAPLRQALELAPGNPSVLLNLADCLELTGKSADARTTYGQVLATVEKDPARDNWDNALMAAQCRAHLGMHEAAIAATQDAIRKEPKNPDALFEAALVYAVSGERTSAIVNARRAVEYGLQPRWLGLPWFDPLKNDTAFVAALHAKTSTDK